MCVPVWTFSGEERLKHVVFCGGTEGTGKLSPFPLISSNLLIADAQLKVLWLNLESGSTVAVSLVPGSFG